MFASFKKMLGMGSETSSSSTSTTTTTSSSSLTPSAGYVLADILEVNTQGEFQALVDQYYRDCGAAVIMFSITSESSFDEVWRVAERLERVKDMSLRSFPLVLVGNKSDLDYDRKVPAECGDAFAYAYNCDYFETSAKTRTNIHETMSNVLARAGLSGEVKVVLAGAGGVGKSAFNIQYVQGRSLFSGSLSYF
tara:strand:+ start:52 stop:630 length:579 start_codon:yes stop_codon:yes gene_type:complete